MKILQKRNHTSAAAGLQTEPPGGAVRTPATARETCTVTQINGNQVLLPLVFLLLLAFGLRLYRLDSQSLWWDELKTVQRASMSLPELMADLAGHRAHLPLYFMLMRGWHWLGSSAFVTRFFSVIWGVLGCAAIFQLGRQMASTKVGLMSAFLLTISPFHFWYSQEARMYSLLPTLFILATYLIVLNLRQNKWRYWLLYALLITAATATHYFAFLVIMAHYVFFVLHYRQLPQQARRWFMMMIVTGILLLPLGLFILSGRGDNLVTVPPWINTIHWYDPLLTLWNFSIGPGIDLQRWVGYAGTALFFVGFLATIQLGRKRKANNAAEERPFPSRTLQIRLLLYWFVVPLGLVFLVSLNWPFLPDNPFSLYLDRYLIIALPPFLLLVAWGFDRLSKNQQWVQPLFIIVALLLEGASIWQLSHNPAHFRNDWRTALQLVQEGQEDAIVVVGQQDIILPLEYYGSDQITFVQIPPPDGEVMSTAYNASMNQQMATARQTSTHVWLIEAFYNHDTHQFPDKRSQLVADESQSMAQTWLNSNFRTLAQHNFPGLRLTLYDLETAVHEQ